MPSSRPAEVRALAKRYFCGCLPVIVGSFVSSAVLAILSFIMIIGIIFLLTDKKDIAVSVLPHDIKVGLSILLAIFILLLLISALGIIGTIRRNRALIRIYSWMVLALTVILLAGEVYLIDVLFLRKCQNQEVGGVDFECISVSSGVKVFFLFISLLLLGVQIYVAFVIRSYDKQLQDEEYLFKEYMTYNNNAFDMSGVGRKTGDASGYAKIPHDEPY